MTTKKATAAPPNRPRDRRLSLEDTAAMSIETTSGMIVIRTALIHNVPMGSTMATMRSSPGAPEEASAAPAISPTTSAASATQVTRRMSRFIRETDSVVNNASRRASPGYKTLQVPTRLQRVATRDYHMRNPTRLALLLSLTAATSVAAQGPEAPRRAGPGGPPAAQMLLAQTGELELTDAQVVRLAAIARRSESRRRALRAAMDSAETRFGNQSGDT